MMDENGIRINKYLSISGCASRREADSLIENGRVQINGILAKMGTRVFDKDKVTLDGKIITPVKALKVYSLYKPIGIISSMSDEQGKSLKSLISQEQRLFPVGRLDKDSEGLIIMTNDGELMNNILKASNRHEKEYIVKVDRKITGDFLKKMSEGVPITNGATGKKIITAPCKIKKIDDVSFSIILIQGLNRQIRRMCGFFDYKVLNLKRIRIMNIDLMGLHPGEIKEITGERLEKLKEMMR